MGSNLSSAEEGNARFLKDFQSKFYFLKEVNDNRFGDIQIFKEKQGDDYVMIKARWCNSGEDYSEFINQVRNRKHFDHPNLLRLLGFHQSGEENFCGDLNKLTTYFEYFDHDLDKEVDTRGLTDSFMTEPELWYLMDSIVASCHFLEQHKIYHGDLRPSNIMLTPTGFVKIADHGLIHTDLTGYLKMLSGTQNEVSFLSPLLLRALSQKDLNPRHDPFKSDIFSLGLTLLEAATLVKSSSVYDFRTHTINYNAINQLLDDVASRYSPFFTNLVSELLHEDEALRPTFGHLAALLAPYKQKALYHQPQPQVTTQTTQPVVTTIPQSQTQSVLPKPNTLVTSQQQPTYRTVQQPVSNVYQSQQPIQYSQAPLMQSTTPVYSSQVNQNPVVYQSQVQQTNTDRASQLNKALM